MPAAIIISCINSTEMETAVRRNFSSMSAERKRKSQDGRRQRWDLCNVSVSSLGDYFHWTLFISSQLFSLYNLDTLTLFMRETHSSRLVVNTNREIDNNACNGYSFCCWSCVGTQNVSKNYTWDERVVMNVPSSLLDLMDIQGHHL